MAEITFRLSAVPERIEELKRTLDPVGPSTFHATTYYDSTDLKLRRHGLNLCVREEEGRCIQTFKSDGFTGGTLISRGEWEDVIASDRPDFTAPETGPRLREAITPDELRPLFKTIVQRTAIALEPRPLTRIEMAIDEGEIRDGNISESISEIELELKSGDPAAIYDIALHLLKVAPLRIETRSKSERGYRLVDKDDGSASAVYAAPATLDGSMTVESALQSIGRSCIGHLRGNEPAALSGQAEGVHQIWVAVRRLRAALSAVKPIIPAEHYNWAQGELKWLAGELGPARNWDVFVANLLEPSEKVLSAATDLNRLAQAAELQRQAAYARAKEAIESPRYTTMMLKFAQWFEAQGWHDQPISKEAALLFATIGEVAPGLIERRWRQARKRSRHFGKLAPEQRHELRIALKKLRYTIEFLRDLFGKDEVKALEKRLKPLQEDLGHMNDLRTAHDLVANISSIGEGGNEVIRAGGIVLGWYNRALSDRKSKLRKDVRRLRRAKPFWPHAKVSLVGSAEDPAAQDPAPITGGLAGTMTKATDMPQNVHSRYRCQLRCSFIFRFFARPRGGAAVGATLATCRQALFEPKVTSWRTVPWSR